MFTQGAAMKKSWTRRKFLESTLKGSIVAGGAVTAGVIVPAEARTVNQGQQNSDSLDLHQRELLRAAMDEIIPAGDGMPSASEVGGVDYLARIARENPKIRKDLRKSLSTLAALSRKQFGKEFTSLAQPERVEALKKFQAMRPQQNFVKLRDYVYEAYYTQPKVWKQLGYSFYPTNAAGPRMKPFDPSSLDRVRKMGKLYREVS
jgi:Gluconate 2-dehydrogenase subunit 3